MSADLSSERSGSSLGDDLSEVSSEESGEYSSENSDDYSSEDEAILGMDS